MQFAKEIINNSEMRSRLYEKFNSLRSKAMREGLSLLTTTKLKTILLVSLVSFTSLLVRQTIHIQHSCNPMIHWSGNLPAECQVAVSNSFDSFDEFSSTRTQTSKNEFGNFDDFSSPTKKEFKASKQQSQITSDQITYGPPSPDLESLQHNTETNLETLPDQLFEPFAFVEYVKENRDDAIKIGVAVGVCASVVGIIAGAPIAGTIVLATGTGVSVGLLWQGIKSIF